MPLPKKSLGVVSFKQHFTQWKDCERCFLHQVRQTVVLAKGKVPCDVLFIGEAPGRSEDDLGVPFVGPAGKRLEDIIERALVASGRGDLRIAMTNLISCIPLDDDGQKLTDPPVEAVEACKPRLEEFVVIADPKLIVTLGKCPTEWLKPGFKDSIRFHRDIPSIDIIHPAAILRANVVQQGLMIQRAVVTLSNAFDDVSKSGG